VDRRSLARIVFALTAAAVLVGLVVQLGVSYRFVGGRFSGWAAVGNVFAYFTVQSNILVGVTTALLALRPERASTLFAVLRLTALVAITVTFAVFHTVLAGLQDLSGQAAFADALLHTVVPVLAVGGWLVFGPRGLATHRVAVFTLIFPLAWAAFTLLRGPAADFYPYPFIDVRTLGYPRVLVNVALVGVLFLGLALAAATLDRRLPGRRRGPVEAGGLSARS
jgi:hypothetical protein